MLSLDFIDSTRTYTNSITEIHNILGIEAARQAIFNELSEVIEFDGTYINYHHLTVLCDRMTYNDKMISIFRHGINNDDIGPIAKASFEETPEMFLKAARHGELDIMKGVSSNVMCGQQGYYGTNSFKILLDNEYILSLKPDTNDANLINNNLKDTILNEFTKDDNTICNLNNLKIHSAVNSIKQLDLGNSNDYDLDF